MDSLDSLKVIDVSDEVVAWIFDLVMWRLPREKVGRNSSNACSIE